MSILSQQQIEDFHRDGFLLIENAVDAAQLAAMQADFSRWVEESRQHDEAYGECIDGRARFDLEPGHSESAPALRRINAPVEVSESYLDAMQNSHMTDAVADLIGPNVKFHHSKINSKLPGAATKVK